MHEIKKHPGYVIFFYYFFDLAFTGDTRETSQALANGQVSVSLDLLVHKTSK